MSEDRYTEDFKPHYRVRDESYETAQGEYKARYHIERVTATGRQSWGITTYYKLSIAEMIVAVLNTTVLYETRG